MEIAGHAITAVDSLLGRLTSFLLEEVKQLRDIPGELHFIKDEMESMNSFLLDLTKVKEPSNQQQAWARQIEQLARQAEHCISRQEAIYLRQLGSPAATASRAVRWGSYLLATAGACLHVPLVTVRESRRLALEIRELKERIDNVSQRRQRYGAEAPTIPEPEPLGAVPESCRLALEIRELNERLENVSQRRQRYGAEAPTIPEQLPQQQQQAKDADYDMSMHAPVVSNNIIRRSLGFNMPMILEDLTADLVKMLQHHQDQKDAEEGLPKTIIVAAPHREDDGITVVRKAYYHDPAVQKLFGTKHWITLSKEKLAKVDARSLLRCILDDLREPADKEEGLSRDGWGDNQLTQAIKEHLKLEAGKRSSLVVIQGLDLDREVWQFMKQEALPNIGCTASTTLVVITRDARDAMNLPRPKAITCSVLNFFSREASDVMTETYGGLRDPDRLKDDIDTLRNIFNKIQERCDQPILCMKMFLHYLYAHLDASRQELQKLLWVLVPMELVLDPDDENKTKEDNARRLVRFCYDDLPPAYKGCLLYLAIFLRDSEMRRPRLVHRCIAEGLIAGRDAEHCFDTLVNRLLVVPVGVDVTGKVKSCKVARPLVWNLITEIAKEKQFLDARLPHHLASHFSIRSGLKLRGSESIDHFMRSLHRNNHAHTSSQLNLLKVLDLEGYRNLEEGPGKYLKHVCDKMFLLGYLGLRGTNLARLPRAINNLILLETLDIRQTQVSPKDTKGIKLLKLKHLLAGGCQTDNYSVAIPRNIRAMANMEVLSHVLASQRATGAQRLLYIGELRQLRKLGVDIIDSEDHHLQNLLIAISDLSECLQSLSIRIKSSGAGPTTAEVPCGNLITPNLLESLKFSGTASVQGKLLPYLLNNGDHQRIAKVTLRGTKLMRNQTDGPLQMLAKLPCLRCLKLGHDSYSGSELTLGENEFQDLRFLVVECPGINAISFDDVKTKTCRLEKIVWYFFDKLEKLSGINRLHKLEEVDLTGDVVPDEVRQAIMKHDNKKLAFKHTRLSEIAVVGGQMPAE